MKTALIALLMSMASAIYVDGAGMGVPFGKPGWNTDWNTAFAEAKARNTPLLIFFTSEGCGPCEEMETTFADSTVRARLERDWTLVVIDAGDSKKTGEYNGRDHTYSRLAAMFRAYAVPTLVFLDRNGEPLRKIMGSRDAGIFSATLDYVSGEVYKKGVTFEEYQEGL